MKFTHLHVHSHYSLLDGLAKIDQILDACQEMKMASIALTDHGSMYGLVEFFIKAKKRGMKPIMGVEAYVTPDSRFEKRPNVDTKRFHLILLAKNKQGYENLVKLTTKAYLEGFYYKPRIDKELLQKYGHGLIATSACLAGEVPRAIIAGKMDKAEKLALEYQEYFGKGNFYLELQHHPGYKEQKPVNDGLIKIARKHKLPLIATNDSHYVKSSDAQAHDVLLSVQTDKKFDDMDRMTMKADDFSIRSQEQMIKDFKDYPEAIENTQKIVSDCQFEFELGKYHLPHFEVPGGQTPEQCLNELCQRGLSKRYGENIAKEIKDRLSYELKVIESTGFASYFLIVADFVNWAKGEKIGVGPGRGSAAGSIVSYLIGVTDIDPLKYDLLFERFLNPERISLPDIDLDFADDRRDEVIQYVAKKYGADHVAQIITFGTMAARGAVRDVGRAMDYSYTFCDQVAKMIPFGLSLDKAIHESPELHQAYETDENTRTLIDMAKQLEGVARHASTHACGVVITKDPLDLTIPCQHPSQGDDTIVTQYEMHAIEDLGLLKMDFLGLRTLSVIQNAINAIKKHNNIDIDISKIPLNDKNTFKLFQQAQSTAVFQLESQGMKRNLKELKPTVFEDIIAMVALYRPGPMEFIPEFIARKHGLKEIVYLHPKLKPILESTYAVMIYQEQLMRIARDLAGFSLSEADVLRKAVGKKIKKLLDEQRDKMIDGMVNNDIDKKIAVRIWETIEPFAQYGFNKCLTQDTEIIDADTGLILTIKELLEQKAKPYVLTKNNSYKLGKARVVDVFSNGVKDIYQITTQSGRQIKATGNHPFLTIGGWTNLSELKPNNRLGIARTIPIFNKGLKNIKDHQLTVLGYVLAEGNLCHPASFYFYSTDKNELNDYISALEKFKNTRATINRSKKATSVYAARIDKDKESEAVRWFGKIGLRYKKAVDKEFPKFVFQLNNKQLALVLGKMFQGDGCININKEGFGNIYYATSSLKLARQLHHLLLRLDIFSALHNKKFKYRNQIKLGYTININRYNNLVNFNKYLGPHLIGKPKLTLDKIIKNHPIINGKLKTHSARGSTDIIPIEIRETIRREIRRIGLSHKEFGRRAGISHRLFGKDPRKKGYLRETLNIIAQQLESPELIGLANSDIYWDKIKEIKKVGREETYDLTIDKTHNFVANDFIVHNSHSTCYALIGYQTAYLKAHYPVEFMASAITSEQGDIDRVAFLVSECKQMGIDVLAPDVNESFHDFTKTGPKSIRFGLNAVKNVGHNVVHAIVAEREQNGKFQNIADFIERVNSKDLNKKSLESLTKCGAMDFFGERNQILAAMDQILTLARETQKAARDGQASLFGGQTQAAMPTIRLPEVAPASKIESLGWEKELLGMYLSDHPLDMYQKKLAKITIATNNLTRNHFGKRIRIGGIINKIKKIDTKNGQPMLFVEIEDLAGKIESIVFPSVLEQTADAWQEERVVVVSGRLSDRDANLKILCDSVKVIEQP